MSARKRTLPNPAPRTLRVRLSSLCLLVGAGFLWLSCGPMTESRLAEGRSLQGAGQFEASIPPLREVLSEEVDHPEANYLLGVALVRTGKKSLAVWPLRKAMASDDYAVQAGLLLGSSLQSNESLAEAVRAYSSVLETDPANVAALTARGSAHISRGFPELALADADRLLELAPENQRATLLRAAALLDLKRPDEAETLLTELAEQAAESNAAGAGRTCAALALFLSDHTDRTRARETYLTCLEKYPDDRMLQKLASDFFLESKEPDAAIQVWRAAVEAKPESLDLRLRLAQTLTALGLIEEAESVHQEAVQLFDSSQAWKELAEFYRVQKNPMQARVALEEAMQRSREVSEAARFALADLLISEGNLQRARQITESLDNATYQHMLRGSILLKLDQPAQALSEFDAGLMEWPNNAGARYLAGLAALAVGDHKRALAEYREAVRTGERDTDAALRASEIHYRMGNFGLAQEFATRHYQNRPDPDGRAQLIAARSFLALGQYSEAEAVLSRMKSRIPNDASPFIEFASLTRQQQGPEAAIEVIISSELDLTDLTHIDATRTVMLDHLTLNQTPQAKKMIDGIVAANPESAESQNLLAEFYLLSGQREKALEALESILAADSENMRAILAKGSLVRDQGNLPQARQLFEQALAVDPRSSESLYKLGQVDLMEGNEPGAEQRFKQALQVDPFLVGPNNDLAWILASQGRDLEQALILANRAVRRDPNADTLDTLGYVQLQSGEAEKAAATLSKALEARPDSASIGYRLGSALAAQGDTDRARQVLTRALETPSFPEAESAREELARLQGS